MWFKMARRDEENAPFLSPASSTIQASVSSPSRGRVSRTSFILINAGLLLVHLVILMLNISVFIGLMTIYPACRDSVVIDGRTDKAFCVAPATSAIPFKINRVDVYALAETNPFVGEPRRELDQAWTRLLRPTNIRITEDEMRMNKTSIALRDGSGYVGYLEAYHMLHCLKRMKQFRHLDHYSHVDHSAFELPHWDHCIEVLRQGITCNADLTIDTLYWKDEDNVQAVSSWPRKCRDWNAIEAWADTRIVEIDRSDPSKVLKLYGEDGSIGPADLL